MKKINKLLGLTGIIFAGLLSGTVAQAQTMYRCGNVYQDRPCDGTQKGTKLIGGSSTATSPNGAIADAACAQRGAAAQKIVWAREGGAILDQQLAKANGESEEKLINEVYARRGTSSDIRAAIEADCIAAKEKATQATSGLLEAIKASQPPASATAASASSPPPQNKALDAEQKAEAAIVKDNAAREAANRKIRCDYMNNQIQTVLVKQRAGSDARTMEDLKQQKQDVERRMSADKCL